MKHVRIACDEHEWRVGSAYPHIASTEDGRLMNTITGRELATRVGKTGYQQVTIRPDGRKGKARLVKVHRVVAEAWHGPAPTERHVVNHKDGDKLNNHASNLEWVTPAENTRHAYRLGLYPRRFGEAASSAKLTDDAVRRIRRVYTPYHPRFGARPLAQEYGVCHSQILDAAYGRSWPHLDGARS